MDGSHEYGDEGSYIVTVTVQDDDGGSHFDTFTVTVGNDIPVVNAGNNQSGVPEGTSISLDPATFTDSGVSDTHTAEIDWGDGTVEPGTVTQGAGSGSVDGGHTYDDNAVFTVRVTVTDDEGEAGFDEFTVTVDNVDPLVTVDNSGVTVDEG